MYIALESAVGLHLEFELPPKGSSIVIQAPTPYHFASLLIEQSKWSKDERLVSIIVRLVSLIVRWVVHHHESDTRFRYEMK